MDRAFWDERYRQKAAIWSGEPNAQLVDCAAELSPGRALEVGAGEGGDAIWLAERGWSVLAVDISPVALDRAQACAAAKLDEERVTAIEWRQADLSEWTPPASSFELVSAQFFHLPAEIRPPIYRKLAAAVAPGGSLVIVGHHPSDLETGVKRPPRPDLLFTAEQIAEELGVRADDGSWTILAQDARPRPAKDSDGNPATVHDAVLCACRS
jgi:SAM-dependent methyltransferase